MLTDRPLSDKEIKILRQNLKQLDKRKSFQVKFLFVWTILAVIVGSIFYFKLETTKEYYLLVGTVVIYALIGVWSFTELYLKQNRQRKKIDFVFKDNKVKSIKVISTDYIELSEVEDEGVHYLFQLPNDKILSFGGQDFYPTKKFPSDNFEIALCYGPKNEILLLEKFVYGDKLSPKMKITGLNKLDLIGNPSYPDPEKFTIIDGQLENIETIINGK
jgi:hypothetical protein